MIQRDFSSQELKTYLNNKRLLFIILWHKGGVTIKNIKILFGLSILLFLIPSLSVYAANFVIGDTVEVVNAGSTGLVVRGPNACDGQIGGKFDGDRGTVLSGPSFCSSYNRWKIRWSDGLEGWSAENWLSKVTITPSTKFSINDKVLVETSTLKVRSDPPELADIGSVSDGAIGTVINGPFYGVPKGSSGFYHFWKVNYGSITGWSAEDFQSKLLPKPSLSNPSNNAVDVPTEPLFSWSSVSGASSYRIMVSPNSNSLPTDPRIGTCSDCVINSEPPTNSYQPAPGKLNPESTYYWTVHGRSSNYYGEWSEKWKFTTKKQSQCSSGPCCDTSTGTFRPSTYKCQEDVSTEYACPWGTACGADVGVRHQDIYCSGSSSVCDGSLQYDSWTVADDCSTIEVCQTGNSVCVSSTCGKFKIGDTIKVVMNINVRTGAGTSYPEITDPDYIGYAPAGASGTILEGPQTADGYTWWKVDFGPGKYTGWSIEDGLAYASGVTAALEQKLLDYIDQHASTYYRTDWNMHIEQFKAWIATIARAEGNKGGYGAHSQGAPGSDLFYHKSSSTFRFSTGLGPFQLDRGSTESWDLWNSIEKLDVDKAVKSVMNIHKTKFGSGATLETFAAGSPWFAVNPTYGGNPSAHWNAVTGQSWDSYKSGKTTLDWSAIKSQLAQNANDPMFLYDNNIKSVGSTKWNIKETENIVTASGKKVVFNGYFPTWQITARSWSGVELFKYYYTYDSNQKLEVWVWDNAIDAANKFKYIFIRDYSNGALPEHISGNIAGATISTEALALVSKCTTYPGSYFIPAHLNGFTGSDREVTFDIRYIIIHTIEGSYSSAVNWFQNPAAGVSAHYIISKTGNITSMVCGEDIAYHAGNWEYNKHSIGIEHEGFVSDPNAYTQPMYQASADLVKWLLQQYNIQLVHSDGVAPPSPLTSTGIIGHNQVPDPTDPSKGGGINHHTDPGTYWNWTKYMAIITGTTKADGQLCSSNTECQSNYCEGSPSNSARCCSTASPSDGWYGGGDGGICTFDDPTSSYRDYYCTSSGSSSYEVANTADCDGQDGWYNYGDSFGCNQLNDPTGEQRDYYVVANTNSCAYSTCKTLDCDTQDGYYGGGNTQISNCGVADNDESSQQRDYYVTSTGTCDFTTQNCETVNCNTQDNWYGGGNAAGCGDDSSSHWRDYHTNINSNTCTYTSSCTGTNFVDCDSSDICSNICNNNNVSSYKDYYVIADANVCAYQWGSTVEVCLVSCNNGACISAEICNNGIDDDNDGYADCSDADCPQGTPSQNGFCCGSGCSTNGGTCADASVFGFVCSDGNCNTYGEACKNGELESSLLCSGKYLSCSGGTCEQNFGAPTSCDEISPGNSVCEFGGLFNERACEVSGANCYLEAEYLCNAPSSCDEKSKDACSSRSGFQCEWQDAGDNVIEECEFGCGAIQLCDEQQSSYEYASCSTAGQTYFADRCSSSCKGEDRDDICRSSTFAADCTATAECNGIQAGTSNCDLACNKISSIHEALLLYAEEASSPRFRSVNNGNIGNELIALDVGAQPDWIEVASSPNSKEMVMVTLDEYNDVNVQVWNGNSWGNKKELTVNSQYPYNSIDVEYVDNGNSMVAFADKSGDSISDTKPRYVTWNGISWSSSAQANSVGSIPNTLKLASDPHQNEMILVTNDATADIDAQVWNGNVWGNVLELTSNSYSSGQPFDVAYESLSGDGIIVYTNKDNYDKRIHYRIVTNGVIGPEQHGPSLGNYGRMYNLIPNPKSDEIILMVLDLDLDTRILVWNGNTWSDKDEISTSSQSSEYMSITGTYSNSGKAILVYSDNSIVPKYRVWDGSTLSPQNSLAAMQDVPRWMKIASHLVRDEVTLIANAKNNHIDAQLWNGNSWSKTIISTYDTTSTRNGIGVAYNNY